MYYLLILCVFKLLSSNAQQSFGPSQIEFTVLKNNLYESLILDPKLSADNAFTNDSADFIENVSEQFLTLTSKLSKKSFPKSKRSVSHYNGHNSHIFDSKDVSLFTGIKPYFIGIKPYNDLGPEPVEVELFKNEEEWYTLILDKDPDLETFNLKILTNNDKDVNDIISQIKGIKDYSLDSALTLTFIGIRSIDSDTSGIYLFQNNNLVKVQRINFSNAIDFKIWSFKNKEVFLFALFKTKTHNKLIVYKWLDTYFDPLDEFETSAQKLYPFSNGDKIFLALLNIKQSNDKFDDYFGEYGEVFSYNIGNNKMDLQQRIPTSNCSEFKHFNLKTGFNEDLFLIATNTNNDNPNKHSSIIYRYLDDYFIPFQTITTDFLIEWLPIETSDAFLMIMMTEYEMITYQFDGWMFRKTDFQPDLALEDGVKSIRYYEIKDIPLLMVCYKNLKNEPHIYRLEFTQKNQLKQFQNEMLGWCHKSLTQLRDVYQEKHLVKREISDENVSKNGDQTIVENLKARINLLINDIEQKIDNSLQTPRIHRIETLRFNEIQVTNHTFAHSLKTEILNENNVDTFLQQKMNINEATHCNYSARFDLIQIDSPLTPIYLNEKDSKRYLRKSADMDINELITDGTAAFEKNLEVQNLNGIEFTEDNVVINNRDQIFDWNFKVNTMTTKNLEVEKINEFPLKNLNRPKETKQIEYFKTLKAKNIIIGGFLNDIDIRTIDKYALKTIGDQEITGKYYFNHLSATDMNINNLSGRTVRDNLLTTKPGNYYVPGSVRFLQNLTVNELDVKEFLDLIPVENGKLSILLKDSDDVQHISEKKIAEDVIILSPLKLRGKIESEELEKLKPVKTIKEPIILDEDVTITGNTSIEKLLMAKNIITNDGEYSLQKLSEHGVTLQTKEIKPHLEFTQQLNVDEIFINQVNGLDPQEWVVMGTSTPQKIHGWKIFSQDLNITGNTNIYKINNIDVQELNEKILRKNGDQVIEGKHSIINIIANSLNANSIEVGDTKLEDLLTISTPQTIEGTTFVNKNISSNMSHSDALWVKNTLNGQNFTKIMKDRIIPNDITKSISGHKIIQNLTINNLESPHLKLSDMKEFFYNGDINLEHANVENILFTESCNGIEEKHFNQKMNNKNEIHTVPIDINLDNLIVYGDVIIESNSISGVDLNDLIENSVKTDEPYEMNSAIFDEVSSEDDIKVVNNIEGIDLDNLILPNFLEEQNIVDKKTFTNNVFVNNGTVLFKNFVDNVDYKKMCDFAINDPENSKILNIKGNVMFSKRPNVYKMFNISLNHIMENAWFKDQKYKIKNTVNVENLIFRNAVRVNGLVDNVNLTELNATYFSKTKDQNISNALFSDQVIFDKDITAPSVTMNGKINDINVGELQKTVLLQDVDQLFENNLYFEYAAFEDLKGDFLVNDYSLSSDLMRYDKLNLVTGHKVFENLNIDILQIKEGINIQNVNMIDWLQNAIPKTGEFSTQHIKILKGRVDFLQGVTVRGTINGINMTEKSLILKSKAQNITGKLQFMLPPPQPISFKNLKVKGTINGIDMNNLMQNQIYGNQDLVFKSKINFHQNIETNNINFKKLYHGVDINELIQNTTDLQIMNELTTTYKKLLHNTRQVTEYLKDQAYYLQSYENIQEIPNYEYVTNLCCGMLNIIACSTFGNDYFMHFYSWEDHSQQFKKLEHAIKVGPAPTYLSPIEFENHQYIYLEYPDPKGPYKGNFHLLSPENELNYFGSIYTFGAKEIKSFKISDQNSSLDCFLILPNAQEFPAIFCKAHNMFYLHQTLPNYSSSRATIAKTTANPLIIIASEVDHTNGNITVWAFDNGFFKMQQIIYLPDPRSVATTSFGNVNYLATVHGITLPPSFVDIRKYNVETNQYENWQKLKISKPKHVEFMTLPSNELFLLVTTENISEPLIMFKLDGISRFVKHVIATNVGQISEVEQFTMNKEHFIMVKNVNNINILHANFKGKLLNSQK